MKSCLNWQPTSQDADLFFVFFLSWVDNLIDNNDQYPNVDEERSECDQDKWSICLRLVWFKIYVHGSSGR